MDDSSELPGPAEPGDNTPCPTALGEPERRTRQYNVKNMNDSRARAPRNRTVLLTAIEKNALSRNLLTLTGKTALDQVIGKTIHQDLHDALPMLPGQCVDLLILDPPYNLDKAFHGRRFTRKSPDDYRAWMDSWMHPLVRLLKPSASIYICGDWQSSTAIHKIAEKYFQLRNRITWEREKGRGAKRNWKNCSEDIWFCTMSGEYTFHVESVKMKRKVIAPYTDHEGRPKDWERTAAGKFRVTHPSNLWTDITIPFWSMPENTDHPTQKPEKLIAKLILASSNAGDVVLDPFLGSGTTSVVARKLGRKYFGIEIDREYCCLAEKRLSMANHKSTIQGYSAGCFWERNTLAEQAKSNGSTRAMLPECRGP